MTPKTVPMRDYPTHAHRGGPRHGSSGSARPEGRNLQAANRMNKAAGGPIARRAERMREMETKPRAVNDIPPPAAAAIACGTCGRRTWRWISFDGETARATTCCFGPGDPWLPDQDPEDRAGWNERTFQAVRDADAMERATGVRP